MSGSSAEEIKSHLKVYWIVFGSLVVFTAATVGAAYLHIPVHTVAIAIGLAIAIVKGTLVALHFMHLNSEKRTIWLYGMLALTAFFFFMCLLVPLMTDRSSAGIESWGMPAGAAENSAHGGHAEHK